MSVWSPQTNFKSVSGDSDIVYSNLFSRHREMLLKNGDLNKVDGRECEGLNNHDLLLLSPKRDFDVKRILILCINSIVKYK